MRGKQKVLVSTVNFGKFDSAPLRVLQEKRLDLVFNPFGRKLTAEEVIELGKDVDGIIAGTEPLNNKNLPYLKNLKVISRCGAGLDNIDLAETEKLHIKVFNTPEAPVQAVAELAVGFMFSLLRKIPYTDKELKKGNWQRSVGDLLAGKTVGIIGLGRIGKKVAELLTPFGVVLLFTDPNIKEKVRGGVKKCTLSYLLSHSDIVTIHIPFSKENKRLLDRNRINLMKRSSILINCARGGIVDEESLFMALKSGKIAGAALDVFDKEPYSGPLCELDNIILTPHIGSYTVETRIAMEIEASRNLLKGLHLL